VRLTFAGLFVFAGLAGGIIVVSSVLRNGPVWLMSTIMVLLFFGLTIAALVLFNYPAGWRRTKSDRAILVKELEGQGLLASESFKARRSFQVGEFEDEGSHYFLELEDGRVLFLSGQYLYDYEPVKEGDEIVRPRRFPNADFVIHRHRVKRYVVDILCNGLVIEPEVVAPRFSPDDFGTTNIPEDGQIITDRTFEQLKNERVKNSPRR